MIKETKRKGFNFYRSYYDVFNELSDKDKLIFIKALLDKQFLDVEPPKLTGMVSFAWISQYNSIDQQVKGYKSKTKDLMSTPTVGGSERVDLTPTPQEEGKGQEKGKEKEQVFIERKEKFILWFNQQRKIKTGKLGKVKILSKTDTNNLKQLLKDYTIEEFQIAFDNMHLSTWAVENNQCNTSHFLRVDNFNKYLNQGEKSQPKGIKNLYD